MSAKTSELIKAIRALPNGENIPCIYQAHMAAIRTEDELQHARKVVHELFELLEGSCEGPGLHNEREWEIKGLLTLWGFYPSKNQTEETPCAPQS